MASGSLQKSTILELGTVVAIAPLKALYRSGRISRDKVLLAIKAVRRGACRDRRGRFASCGGGGAVSQDVRPAGSAGGTREPRRGRPGAGPPSELKPKEVTPPGHLEARRQRVEARLATIGPERAAAKQELDRAKAENDRFRGSTSFTPERQAARTAYGDANRRHRAIESEHDQLVAWEAGVKKNPALVPPGPIKDRLADYKEGDAHIARLQEKLAPVAARKQEYEKVKAEVDDLHARYFATGDEVYTLSSRGDKVGAKAKAKEVKDLEKQINVARQRRDAARDQANSANTDARKVVSETLAVDRPMKVELKSEAFRNNSGQPMQPLSGSNIRDVDTASTWLSGITRENQYGIPIKRKIGERDGQRAYHSGDGTHIALSTKESPDVVVHELGHAIDRDFHQGNDSVGMRSVEFLEHRVGVEAPVRIDSLPGVRPGAYKPDEVGRKDKFDSVFDDSPSSAHYVGKDYGDRESSEILSMGVQALYNDPHKFITKDPEYAKFVIGVLQGDLR